MNTNIKIAVIIVAAGRGTRAGGTLPKQWQPLMGKPVIQWSVDTFLKNSMINEVIVVYHPDDQNLMNQISNDVQGVLGGATRDASVKCGLSKLETSAPDYVLIHDAARPCLDQKLLSECINAVLIKGAVVPAISLKDTLWRGKDYVTEILDRNEMFCSQTPQCFSFPLVLSAHSQATMLATDDAQIVKSTGHSVAIIPGNEDNIKITGPEDFVRAERILRGNMKLRVGNGFDVHRFGPGSSLTLCGVIIESSLALIGHSDADVGMHSVTDAIYGALARGDIGQHFPPSDQQWKGADSKVFLEHAVRLTSEMGFKIENIDCTLICEQPKIGPYADKMRSKMAEIIGLDVDQVSVKATTSEKLGFTGRGEGIAAIATAALISR
ncbi:MAG: bifunctional 2-C-methyl-D-erythritol 4-phosphate cytidylyltransferase/2-C-methyl-D-erythritol 2,4-cyclodiphosphate synthase [Planktomarina sp.]|nr:bifunctional 2-C-methyl-D-erythritol 4-phosphate cytidylyltransferase/2-C-methyl-D-erythritol 2,4-cyclodiphosphate synthase [Planktomarina sp.]